MASEITRVDEEEGEDIGLTDRKIAALDKLHELGAAPREDGKPYSPDRRVRAQQLIYEGRLGGPGRGQGRKRQPRSSAAVAEYVNEVLTPKIKEALKAGLSDKQDIAIRLKTADMALKVEREEAALQLKEDQTDLDNSDKEELIAALIALTGDPGTEAALNATAITLPESSITEIPYNKEDDEGTTEAQGSSGIGTATISEETGVDEGEVGSNGHRDTTRRSEERPNPFTEVARRRAAIRRRAT